MMRQAGRYYLFNTRRDSGESEIKERIALDRSFRKVIKSRVLQLPIFRMMTLGGCPSKRARWRKSSSLERIVRPSDFAVAHTSESEDSNKEKSLTCLAPGKSLPRISEARADMFSSKRSISGCQQSVFSFSGEGEGSSDVVGFQLGKIGQDFCFGHSAGEVAENIGHSDAQIADAGLAAPLGRVDRNPVLEIHRFQVSARPSLRKPFGTHMQQNTTNDYFCAMIMPLPEICNFRK